MNKREERGNGVMEKMKLYIYDHCPYCVKARMIFGIKRIPLELVTLLNDDEETPISMIGKKMVPILEPADGKYMPESMDIVRYIDLSDDKPVLQPLTDGQGEELAVWMADMHDIVYRLAMPRWVQAPLAEFATAGAREYFTRKKEAMIGSFAENMANSGELIRQTEDMLKKLDVMIADEQAVHGVLTEDDIHLFALLRSLSIVKGVDYPEKIDLYRRNMAAKSNIPLHDEIAL